MSIRIAAGALAAVALVATYAAVPGASAPADTTLNFNAGAENLGGVVKGGVCATSWGGNRLDVAGRGTDTNNSLYHKWFDGTWHDWENLEGKLTSAPSCTSWGSNRLDIFVRGIDYALYQKWWDGQWHDWVSLGGTIKGTEGTPNAGAPSCVTRGMIDPNDPTSGSIDCFVIGTDSTLFRMTYDNKQWYPWKSYGGKCASDPGCVATNANTLECFVRGEDNALWQLSIPADVNAAVTSQWQSYGGTINQAPTVALINGDPNNSHTEIMVRGSGNVLWRFCRYHGQNQWVQDPSGITIYQPIAAVVRGGNANANGNPNLDIFEVDATGATFHYSS